jgi:hypothetical protein
LDTDHESSPLADRRHRSYRSESSFPGKLTQDGLVPDKVIPKLERSTRPAATKVDQIGSSAGRKK